jgi:hypothetical protein
MHFKFTHDFDAPLDELERVMFHDGLIPLLEKRMENILRMEPLEVRRDATRLTRRIRYLPVPMISSIGVKKVEPEWMEFFEESSYDFKAHSGQFRNVPARRRIAALLTNSGTLKLESNGRGGSRQSIEGELVVSVFMVGKIAERVIHSNAIKLLEEQAAVLDGVLRNREL